MRLFNKYKKSLRMSIKSKNSNLDCDLSMACIALKIFENQFEFK